MKKIFLLALLALVGINLLGLPTLKADEARRITHKFRAYTADTSVAQGKTIYRISGYATGNNATWAIYNSATLGEVADTNVAVEGGEATSSDALPVYEFPDGLYLDTGSTVVINSCVIVVEYI